MAVDLFTERLAQVRDRFASTLLGKIGDSYAALPSLSGDGLAAVEAVAETYRRIHGICGVGPTVGFPATGKAAREAEEVLLEAYRTHRGLTATENAAFTISLQALREIAQRELQTSKTA